MPDQNISSQWWITPNSLNIVSLNWVSSQVSTAPITIWVSRNLQCLAVNCNLQRQLPSWVPAQVSKFYSLEPQEATVDSSTTLKKLPCCLCYIPVDLYSKPISLYSKPIAIYPVHWSRLPQRLSGLVRRLPAAGERFCYPRHTEPPPALAGAARGLWYCCV